MTIHKDALDWFEIYVSDFKRAKGFYETILRTKLQDASMESCQMGMFPYDNASGVGGSITKMDGMNPGPGGTIVYLCAEGDLDGIISRITGAGGKILRPRMSIGEHGFIAIFSDTEGNVVGLHSMT